MNAATLQLALDALSPHLAACGLIAARLVPVAFLCPLFGGAQAPTHVRLGLVAALTGFLHGACGVSTPAGVGGALGLAALAGREALFGAALGLVAAVPFDAARAGGRFIDLFRGSSAEAALPMAGSRESASGEALFHLLLALVAAGALLPTMLAALARSYVLVAPGAALTGDSVALSVVASVGAAFATGLALGAPIAGLALVIDLGLGLASRAAPQLNLQETGAPLRILGGGAALWLGLGLVAERLLELFAAQGPALEALSRLAAG